MDTKVAKPKVVPFSLKDAPSLIERVWPAQQISVEAQKERKAVHGQTLTSLGSYWKGRKPLILARACVLGALLPATGDDAKDLEIFEMLMGMSEDQILPRFKDKMTIAEIKAYGTLEQQAVLIEVHEGEERLKKLPRVTRDEFMATVIAKMPYADRVQMLLRPEEVAESALTGACLPIVNKHLGTHATTLTELLISS